MTPSALASQWLGVRRRFETFPGCCHASLAVSVVSGQSGFQNPSSAGGSKALEARQSCNLFPWDVSQAFGHFDVGEIKEVGGHIMWGAALTAVTLNLSPLHPVLVPLCTPKQKKKNLFTCTRLYFFPVSFFFWEIVFLSANPSKRMCCNCFSRSAARTVQLNVLSLLLLLFLCFLPSVCHSPPRCWQSPVGSAGSHMSFCPLLSDRKIHYFPVWHFECFTDRITVGAPDFGSCELGKIMSQRPHLEPQNVVVTDVASERPGRHPQWS